MYFLSKEKHVYKFSRDAEPALNVNPGELVRLETMDCFSDQIKSARDELESSRQGGINPATGPIYVIGAEKADTLKITVKEIKVNDKAVILTGKDFGVMGHKLEGRTIKVVPIINDELCFTENIRLPLEPMIGVIGVAPAAGEVSCGIPDVHGGNLDTNLIKEKAEVYLPVWVEGGLLALGDLHALMGDGEIGISGAEVAGEVLIKIDLIKGLALAGPLVKSGGVLAVLCSRESLDDAAKGAVETMVELIRKRTGRHASEITMLLSIAGRLAVSQVVNPLKTARFEVPLWLLEKYGFELE